MIKIFCLCSSKSFCVYRAFPAAGSPLAEVEVEKLCGGGEGALKPA